MQAVIHVQKSAALHVVFKPHNAFRSPRQVAAATMSEETYQVIVSGKAFTLSRGQIEADSGDSNLFAISLLGDFAEGQTRTLRLDRNASIFKIIVEHLSGYRIFPIDSSDRGGMSERKFLRYLQDDAEYYQLDRLHELVTNEIERVQASEVDTSARRLQIEEERLQLEKDRFEWEKVKHERDLRQAREHAQAYACAKRMESTSIYAASRPMQTNVSLRGKLGDNSLSGPS